MDPQPPAVLACALATAVQQLGRLRSVPSQETGCVTETRCTPSGLALFPHPQAVRIRARREPLDSGAASSVRSQAMPRACVSRRQEAQSLLLLPTTVAAVSLSRPKLATAWAMAAATSRAPSSMPLHGAVQQNPARKPHPKCFGHRAAASPLTAQQSSSHGHTRDTKYE
jgi:hypothetical protein